MVDKLPAEQADQDFTAIANTETALAIPDETSVSLRSAVYHQAPALVADDLLMPKLRLAQGLTPEVQSGDVKPGQWVITGYPALASPTIIPLLMGRKRRLQDSTSTENPPPILCSSPDAVVGHGVPGGPCQECPMSKWIQLEGSGKNAPPPCTLIYSYVVYIKEAETLGIVEFSRTGEPAARLINTLIQSRKLGNFAVRLGASQQKGAKGMYYIPQPRIVDLNQDDMEFARQFVGGIL